MRKRTKDQNIIAFGSMKYYVNEKNEGEFATLYRELIDDEM
jgi:hypothetical protein